MKIYMYMYLCFDIKFMYIVYYELNFFYGLFMNMLVIEYFIMVFRLKEGILILSFRVY